MCVPIRRRRSVLLSTFALAAVIAYADVAAAQGTTPPAPVAAVPQPPAPAVPPRADDEPGACFGFSFGRWTPALDWHAAGHGERVDTTGFIHAPEGRDWAADLTAAGDTVLMLFPVWWPAGVAVEVPTRRLASGDTVIGRAVALVSDGRIKPPTAPVRAWRVRCGGSAPRRP